MESTRWTALHKFRRRCHSCWKASASACSCLNLSNWQLLQLSRIFLQESRSSWWNQKPACCKRSHQLRATRTNSKFLETTFICGPGEEQTVTISTRSTEQALMKKNLFFVWPQQQFTGCTGWSSAGGSVKHRGELSNETAAGPGESSKSRIVILSGVEGKQRAALCLRSHQRRDATHDFHRGATDIPVNPAMSQWAQCEVGASFASGWKKIAAVAISKTRQAFYAQTIKTANRPCPLNTSSNLQARRKYVRSRLLRPRGALAQGCTSTWRGEKCLPSKAKFDKQNTFSQNFQRVFDRVKL